ncbi:MAG: ribosome silencing factor [Syntrophobacterales bacterium]|nr:ribosome silencing factor [Syntrophobacterales bacterium]
MVEDNKTVRTSRKKRSKTILSLSSQEKAFLCAKIADNYKAQRLSVLSLEGLCNFTDYFVICSGQSTKQVQGIVDHIEEEMGKAGYRPIGIEGRKEGRWVLMDYEDVVVHVFHDPVRETYDLESLWSEAPNVWKTGERDGREDA